MRHHYGVGGGCGRGVLGAERCGWETEIYEFGRESILGERSGTLKGGGRRSVRYAGKAGRCEDETEIYDFGENLFLRERSGLSMGGCRSSVVRPGWGGSAISEPD